MTETWAPRLRATAVRGDVPFRHWRMQGMLPDNIVAALAGLDLAVPQRGDTAGRRETHNASRRFFDAAMQGQSGAAAAVADAFQSREVVALWREACGAALAGCRLRIEYCQDVGGFWLEPHTDIGAKKFTMLIYLVDPPAGECWGTDLLYPDGTLAQRATGAANSAVIFIPGADTWHGFAKRPISGVRRTLIVNYVGPEWRATHELCFPGQAVA